MSCVENTDKFACRPKAKTYLERRFNASLDLIWRYPGFDIVLGKGNKCQQNILLTDEMESRDARTSSYFVDTQRTVTINKSAPEVTICQKFWRRIANTIKSNSIKAQRFNQFIRTNAKPTCIIMPFNLVCRLQKVSETPQVGNIFNSKVQCKNCLSSGIRLANMAIGHKETKPIENPFARFIKHIFIETARLCKGARSYSDITALQQITNRRNTQIVFFSESVTVHASLVKLTYLDSLSPGKFSNRYPSWFDTTALKSFIDRSMRDIESLANICHRFIVKISGNNGVMLLFGESFIHGVLIPYQVTESE